MGGRVRLVSAGALEPLVPSNSDGVAAAQAQAQATVISGALRLEFGAGGSETIEAATEDFFVIPKRTVHRETNTGSLQTVLAFVRVGTGQLTFEIAGPDPA